MDEIHGVVNAGKEARVYWSKNKEGEELAVKIYLTSSAEFLKGMRKYIEGDRRFKGVKRDTRSLIFTWAQKEFRNLQQAAAAKVNVPKPIAVEKNVLVMGFIGKNGVSAPALREQPLDNPEKVYSQLLVSLKRLYRKAKLVHGDFSEYNIDRGSVQNAITVTPDPGALQFAWLAKELHVYFTNSLTDGETYTVTISADTNSGARDAFLVPPTIHCCSLPRPEPFQRNVPVRRFHQR